MKQRLERIFENIRSYDFHTLSYRLIIYCILLSVIGILAINSATGGNASYTNKQILGLIAGLVIMAIMMFIRYDILARYYWLMYLVNFLLLLSVRIFGSYRGGAKRWIIIGDLYIQPSELTKILLLIFFSALLAYNHQSLNSFKFYAFCVGTFLVPIILILMEPDLSTSIVIFVMFCVIIFVGGFSMKILGKVLLVVLPALAIFISLIFILPADKNIIPEYQYNRLVGFYDPDNENAERIRYQQENSVLAIAGGSLTGKGLNNNSITSVKNAEFIYN